MPWSNQGLQVQGVPRGVYHGHPEVCIEATRRGEKRSSIQGGTLGRAVVTVAVGTAGRRRLSLTGKEREAARLLLLMLLLRGVLPSWSVRIKLTAPHQCGAGNPCKDRGKNGA